MPLAPLLLLLASADPAPAFVRPVPPECEAAFKALDVPEDARDHAWNERYSETYRAAAGVGAVDGVARACEAVALSAAFPARDWRFAESLDELGLLHFQRGDFEASARAQGMAAAEALLAKGPEAPEVATYLARLGLPLAELGRSEQHAALTKAPHRLLLEGFVPAESLRPRVEWLIAEYLRLEDLEAADALRALEAAR